jgi:hypothetical protein
LRDRAFATPLSHSGRLKHSTRLKVSALFCLALSYAGGALAQGQLPDMAPIGAQPGKRPAGGDPNAPETHAAPGEESTLSTGDEPDLPQDPLAISEETREQIGTDSELDEPPPSIPSERGFYGLYYYERSLTERYRLAFPLWAEQIKQVPSLKDPTKLVPDRASAYGGFYYNRRGPTHADDIFFPFFWNLRNPAVGSRTTVVGPFVNRRSPGASDDWFFPLYMTGTRPNGGYTVIPPLLTSLHSDENGGLNIIGPAYCSYKGGSSCDTRTATDIDLGIAPFYFFGQNQHRLYEVIPPLLHYYGYEARSEKWMNVWGPYFRGHTGVRASGKERDFLHLLPFYYSIWGKDERHTTLLPFFHLGHKAHPEDPSKSHERLIVTPLFVDKKHDNGAHTFVTWGYAQHRGPSELDMISPLYWSYRVPSIGLDRKLFFPFVYSNVSQREKTLAIFPLFAQSERFGISRSTWVTPLINYRTHLEGWSFSLHPLVHFGESGDSKRRVVAPLYFDFESKVSRNTVAFPLFWRFAKPDTTTTVVGNVLHREKRYPTGKEWEFHILPLFSYGKSPDGHFWNVLFGLTGYSQKGSASTMRFMYLPIELSR